PAGRRRGNPACVPAGRADRRNASRHRAGAARLGRASARRHRSPRTRLHVRGARRDERGDPRGDQEKMTTYVSRSWDRAKRCNVETPTTMEPMLAEQRDQLNAALAGRYAIERALGSGGMATVYLADDLKHHRKVAIKVLRPELASALGPDRFLREV